MTKTTDKIIALSVMAWCVATILAMCYLFCYACYQIIISEQWYLVIFIIPLGGLPLLYFLLVIIDALKKWAKSKLRVGK